MVYGLWLMVYAIGLMAYGLWFIAYGLSSRGLPRQAWDASRSGLGGGAGGENETHPSTPLGAWGVGAYVLVVLVSASDAARSGLRGGVAQVTGPWRLMPSNQLHGGNFTFDEWVVVHRVECA